MLHLLEILLLEALKPLLSQTCFQPYFLQDVAFLTDSPVNSKFVKGPLYAGLSAGLPSILTSSPQAQLRGTLLFPFHRCGN